MSVPSVHSYPLENGKHEHWIAYSGGTDVNNDLRRLLRHVAGMVAAFAGTVESVSVYPLDDPQYTWACSILVATGEDT